VRFAIPSQPGSLQDIVQLDVMVSGKDGQHGGKRAQDLRSAILLAMVAVYQLDQLIDNIRLTHNASTLGLSSSDDASCANAGAIRPGLRGWGSNPYRRAI
jgi:hypothetical protein